MSNEKLARQWANDYLKNIDADALPELHAAAQVVLAHTAPPTMADVEWDDDTHYLAGCMSPYGSIVMLRPQGANMIVHDLNSDLTEVFDSDDLIPNGKRYELREVGAGEPDAPTHPETLTTVEDYENAPHG